MPDLSWTGLPEFPNNTVTDYTRPTPSVDVSKDVSASFLEQRGSVGNVLSKPMISFVKETDCPSVSKVNNTEKSRKPTVKYVEMYRSQRPRGNQRNWNNQKSQQLGSDFVMIKKACYVCGSFEHLQLVDESMMWHRRLGHLNFKTINKLVRNNLVRGLPSKSFENDHSYVACLKGKQHKASCKNKLVNSVYKPLHTLHMDLFGPTSVSSLNHKWLIWGGVEFKNRDMDDFCTKKGIKREFSNARTPQQNGLAERRNKTLIKAARTMLADAKLPVTFWAEACLHGVMFKLGFRLTSTKDANQAVKDNVSSLRFIALPNWFHDAHMETSNDSVRNSEANDYPQKEQDVESDVPNVSSPVSTVSTNQCYPSIHNLSLPKIISRGGSSYSEPLSLGNVMGDFFGDTTNSTSLTKVEADISNMETDIQVSPTPTLRINKDHLKIQVIGPIDPPVQTRHKAKNVEEQSFIATIHQKTNLDLLQYCLFSCILSQEEPKKIVDALKDESWVEAMQEELLQFQIQNVWVLVDCPKGVRPIGTKWALKNKKDKRGIVIQNKARLVVQGHT
ncbi:putative ribonuclease H-like domain-containing protein [Tanacetum coccineum]